MACPFFLFAFSGRKPKILKRDIMSFCFSSYLRLEYRTDGESGFVCLFVVKSHNSILTADIEWSQCLCAACRGQVRKRARITTHGASCLSLWSPAPTLFLHADVFSSSPFVLQTDFLRRHGGLSSFPKSMEALYMERNRSAALPSLVWILDK